jgi:hypothetical protein
MHTPANPTGRRIAQLICLACSSEHPGEATAAIQALNRTLNSAGLDFHELAKVVETGLRLPVTTEQPRSEFRPRPQPPAAKNKPRRPDGRPLQMDEKLVCDRPNGVFRGCGCGSIVFTIMPGVGQHVAQLVCDGCGSGGRWLSRGLFGATS